jgi:diaminopimelate decarboxylase
MVSTITPSLPTTGKSYLPNPANAEQCSPNQCIFPLTAQVNSADHLEIGGCDVVDLVQKYGSPLYILDEASLRATCRQYRKALAQHYPGEALVLYASKAWNCLAVCAIVGSEGLGVDVVSGGELSTAIAAGISPTQLYLHGNNKSCQELQLAADVGATIVVDNWLDLHTLADIATADPSEAKSTADPLHTLPQPRPIRVMIRLTPGIECHTHDYIRTGSIDSKFGFDPNQLDDVFRWLNQHPSLSCIGLHAHIGSQIFELEPHHDLGNVMVGWLTKATQYGLPIQELNVGGGLGICYTENDDPPSIAEWVQTVSRSIAQACDAQQIPYPKLLCEPGRSLIGTACITAYTLGSQKIIPNLRTYWSVDGGMSDNPRPITYQSLYRAAIANRMSAPLSETVTIAGKHCESGDVLIKDAKLPPCQSGDTLVIPATGAYNYSMSSNYNRIPRPAAVVVHNGEANLILQRETYTDLLRHDRIPERLRIYPQP